MPSAGRGASYLDAAEQDVFVLLELLVELRDDLERVFSARLELGMKS